jgi:hypothetical protein
MLLLVTIALDNKAKGHKINPLVQNQFKLSKYKLKLQIDYNVQSYLFITTSVYKTRRRDSQIFCRTNEFRIVNRNIILLGYKNARL